MALLNICSLQENLLFNSEILNHIIQQVQDISLFYFTCQNKRHMTRDIKKKEIIFSKKKRLNYYFGPPAIGLLIMSS